jgi:hypothetical protein
MGRTVQRIREYSIFVEKFANTPGVSGVTAFAACND